MCHGTYLTSYTCGHVVTVPDTCLRAIDPHYRCEPYGMKITKPVGRCVECFARDLEPSAGLATIVRFNPFPTTVAEEDGEEGRGGCLKEDEGRAEGRQARAILRWVGNVKSLRSLGSRSLAELRGRCSGTSLDGSSEGSGEIVVRKSVRVESLRVDDGLMMNDERELLDFEPVDGPFKYKAWRPLPELRQSD